MSEYSERVRELFDDAFRTAATTSGIESAWLELGDILDTLRDEYGGKSISDGYIVFGVGDTIAGDNDLYWDREHNRLGIHNESPSCELDVNGDTKSNNLTVPLEGKFNLSATGDTYFQQNSGLDFNMYSNGNNRLQFATGSVMRAAHQGALINISTAGLTVQTGYDSIFVVNATNGARLRNNNGAFYWSTGSQIQSPTDSNLLITNNAKTDFGLLQFGGATSAFPAFKRNGSALQLRLADDSGYADLKVDEMYTSLGSVSVPAYSFLGDTNTGMFSPTANTIAFSLAGAESLRLNAAGLGIGKTPGNNLDIYDPDSSCTMNLHSGNSGSTSLIDIGSGGSGNRYAYIDLVGDDTYTDYGLRIIRSNGGANTESRIEHRGTSSLKMKCVESGGKFTWDKVSTELMRLDGTGLGIGTNAPSEKLDVNGDAIRIRTSQTPASAGATGTTGQICWDSSYVYVCVATNTWKRSAISTW